MVDRGVGGVIEWVKGKEEERKKENEERVELREKEMSRSCWLLGLKLKKGR